MVVENPGFFIKKPYNTTYIFGALTIYMQTFYDGELIIP
jgi:hypothetical protein